MSVKLIAIASVASFACAFAAASWVYRSDQAPVAASDDVIVSFDQGLPVEQRIAVLERAVSEERQARQLLQEELFYLTEELEELTSAASPENAEPELVAESVTVDRDQERRADFRRRNSPEGRVARLIEAGFLPGQAELIVQREAALQMESLQARYEAERSGDPQEWYRSRNDQQNALRAELGDADYERYLSANNRSTSIAVSNVIESSPAHAAGLLPGDEIVRYGGERVFSMTDLTQQSMQGMAGENVAVDIMRDGIQMQVVMPRGPFGITGGRRGR
jgi:hypothetical protein